MTDVKLKDLEYYLDDIAEKQLPFACAMALTRTSAKIGDDLAKKAAHQFHTLTPFSRTHRTARIGAAPSPGSSFATLPADKNHGINRMQAVLGNQHWGIAEQIADGQTVRRPLTSKYLWVPISDRKKTTRPGKLIQAIKSRKQGSRLFIGEGKGGHVYIFKRLTKKRYPIQPLFLRRRQQTIKPKFSMQRIVESRSQKYMDYFFEQTMNKALETARW